MGYLTKDGDMIDSNKDATLQSNLIIQKYKKSGRVYIFLSTIIGYIPLPDEYEQGHSPWLWTGDRQNFTGYQLFTNTDGSFRGAFQYRNSKRTSIALSIYDKDREYTYPQEAFTLNLGPVGTKSVGTRSDDQYCWECRMPMSSEDTYCPSCGAGPETLPPAIVIEKATCEQCDLLLSNCICGNGGGNNGDDGDRCPDCLSSECFGECQEIGGGGGTTPGGNQGNIEYYIVNIVTKGNGTAYGSGTYSPGDEVHLEAYPNENQVFNGWSNSGTLFSSSSSFSFVIDDDYDLTANFNHIDSECGILAKKYTNNSKLSNTINLLNSRIAENGSIEYAYAKPENMGDVIYVGTTYKVDIELSKDMDYEYIIHNHPVSNSLIPSIEDLAFYYTEICNGTLKNTSSFLIRASSGIVSFEVEDFDIFSSFINDVIQTEDTIDDYKSAFHKHVLGNPKQKDLVNQSVIEKAFKFYSEKGLKITYAKKINDIYTWSNVSVNGTTVNYINCLN